MKYKYLKLLSVFIFTLLAFTSCQDNDEINESGSVDANISAVTPMEAKPNYPISISGSGFSDLRELFFNQTQILDYELVNDETINLVVPNGTPVGDATITLAYLNNARVSTSFNVLQSEPPLIEAYENIQDANNIVLDGVNFFDMTVTFDGNEVSTSVNGSETQLSFAIPESSKNGISGVLKVANLDGFVNFDYISVGDKIYLFQQETYTNILIDDWDGNGLGAEWDGPYSGVTPESGVQQSGRTGSYLKMASSGESWGGGYEFKDVNYGIPEGVRGKNIYIAADMKFNSNATGVYMIIQLDSNVEPQVIYYGEDLPEYTANPGNIFWGTIAIDPANATGDWQTVVWSQYHDFGPRYRNHADKTAALHPENELRPEDSDNLSTFKIQVPSDGLVDVDIDNVRVMYFN